MTHQKSALFAATAALALIWASEGRAQPAAAPPAGQVEEVVVTARRVEENLQDVPLAVTALGSAELERHSIRQVEDLQTQVPNLYLQKANGDPQALTVAIRGQRQNDILLTLDPSVGMYVDGVNLPRTLGLAGALMDIASVEVLRGPQGTLYGRNTTGGAISFHTNDPTDRFGGSIDVTGGNFNAYNVIGVLNLPLTEGLALRLVAQRGAHDGYAKNALGQDLADEDSRAIRAKLKAELGERVTAVLEAGYQRNDTGGPAFRLAGISPTATAARVCNAPFNAFGGCIATAEVNAEMYLAGGGAPSGLTAALFDPARIAAAQAALASSTSTADFYRTGQTGGHASNFKGYNLGLNLDVKLADNLTLRSISGLQTFTRFTNNDLDATPFNIIQTPLQTRDRFASEELQLLGGDKTLNWVGGVYVSDEKGHDGGQPVSLAVLNAANNPTFTVGDVFNGSKAIYAQGNWAFAPRWGLTLGYRYSSDSRKLTAYNSNRRGCLVPAPGAIATPPGPSQCPRTFANTFDGSSWLASVNYNPVEDTMLYAKVARGYRTGGQNLRGSGTQISFQPFEPETDTEYEAGVKSDFLDRRVRLNLAAYYDDYKNIQRSVVVRSPAGTPVSLVTNAASGKIKGFEAEMDLRPSSAFTVRASAGYTNAKYDKFVDLTGDRSGESFGVPKWTATLDGEYHRPTPLGEAMLIVGYHWHDQVQLAPDAPTLAQVTQGAYGLLDARVSLNVDAWNTQIAVFGKNLLGKEYYVSSTSLERSLGFNVLQLGTPRVYGIEIKKRFGAF